MNKKSNKNEKLDLNKVSGGGAFAYAVEARALVGADAYDVYGFTLRVGQDGVIKPEDVAQLKEAGYYFRNNQLVIDPLGINKTLNTKETH